MSVRMSRRGVLVGTAAMIWGRGAVAGAPVVGDIASAATSGDVGAGWAEGGGSARARAVDRSSRLAALEKREGGRLGVVAVDTATGRRFGHRADERFPLCSTFKFLAAAAILQLVDRGKERLDRKIEYGPGDLLEYAPVAKEHVKEGAMVLADVCSAAVEWSDNTAANLILKILGGPEALTKFIRSLGDAFTRVDMIEPSLNVVGPGDVRNTTTPAAMAGSIGAVLFGQVLSADSRATLEGWMLDSKVGQNRIAAGLPAGWRIAHKTGTWSNQTNDVGVVWPIGRAPIIVTGYYTRGGTKQEQREGVLREVGRIVATSF